MFASAWRFAGKRLTGCLEHICREVKYLSHLHRVITCYDMEESHESEPRDKFKLLCMLQMSDSGE